MTKYNALSFFILLLLPFTLLIGSMAAGGEEALYDSILKASSIKEKGSIAGRLALIRSSKSKQLLIKLINHQSYWNRTAAVNALFSISDNELDNILFDKMMNDHMIDDVISEGFKKNMKKYYPFLAEKYRNGLNVIKWKKKDKSEFIIRTISASGLMEGEKFLKNIIEDRKSEDRDYALKSLSLHFSRGNYKYIKSHIEDSQLRTSVLSHIVSHGEKGELGLFRTIIDRREKPEHRIIAFTAVMKWGSGSLKEKVFLDSLEDSDFNVVRGALLTFENIRSPGIKKQLFHIIKYGGIQETRLLSGVHLTGFEGNDTVPYLIMLLDESFSPRERGGVDIAITALTFGITSIFDDLHQKSRKSRFWNKMSKIAEKLKGITGEDFAYSYNKWYQWAILNGYTIRGVNIIQFLFSGSDDIRRRAVENSIRLLGFNNSMEFYKKYPGLKNSTDLVLLLAKLLIEKGYLVDDK